MTSSTSTIWLLDTNIISHAIRFPHGPLAKRIQQLSKESPERLCTSVVVTCELRFGVTKKGSSLLAAKVETLLRFIPTLDIDSRVVPHYATIRTHMERQGTPIGPNDTLIAAHALALGCTLVTDNETEFRRVPGLRVENWLNG